MPAPLKSLRNFAQRHYIWLGAAGLCALWLIYQSNARFIAGSDVYPARFLPISLVTNGDYDMNEFTFIREKLPNGGYGIGPGTLLHYAPGERRHNRLLSNSPTLVPTLTAFSYWIPFRVLGISPEHFLVFYMDKAWASLFVTLSALFLFLALREEKTPRSAAWVIVMAYALGTSAWAICSQSLWQHPPSQCFLALSLWLWLRRDRTGTGSILLGLALGCAVGARPSNAMWTMIVLLDTATRMKWRQLFGVILGGLPPFLFVASYNWIQFGRPWHTAYRFIGTADLVKLEYLPAGALGLLFSPSLGLLPNAPFYLLVPLALWIGLRRPLHGARRRHILIPLLFVIAHTLFYGCFLIWWAGWSFCYRYLTDMLPILSFLFFPLWRIRPLIGGKWVRRFACVGVWLLFWAGALVGMAVQAYGVYMWSGQWFFNWESINQKLYVKFDDHARGTIFDHDSVLWTLDPDKHLILCERKYWKSFSLKAALTTYKKVHRDLFETKLVPYGPTPPIILDIGRPVR